MSCALVVVFSTIKETNTKNVFGVFKNQVLLEKNFMCKGIEKPSRKKGS